MKLKLKNIKHSEFASQETNCYQAVVYLNGKPFADVSNDGHGGCDYQPERSAIPPPCHPGQQQSKFHHRQCPESHPRGRFIQRRQPCECDSSSRAGFGHNDRFFFWIFLFSLFLFSRLPADPRA